MAMVNKIKKGNVEKDIHDTRIPELTGEEAFCVPFVNEDGDAFQIGSIPSACLDNGSVTTEKIADDAVTLDKMGADVLSKIPGIVLTGSKDSSVAQQCLRFVSDQPVGGNTFNIEVAEGDYDRIKSVVRTMRPCYAIFTWNIDWSVSSTQYRRNTVLLREVDRETASGNADDVWQIVLEGDAGGYRYTITISFAHMKDMVYYFDNILCTRTALDSGDGRNLPVLSITNEEFAEVASDFLAFINGITGLTSKWFYFTGTTVKEKIKSLIDSGAFLCKLNVSAVGNKTGFGWVPNSKEIYFTEILYRSPSNKYYRCSLIFGYTEKKAYVSVLAEPYTHIDEQAAE